MFDEMRMGTARKIDLYLRPLGIAQTLLTWFYGNSCVHIILTRKTFLPTKMHWCHWWKNTILIQRSTEQNLQITCTSAGNYELSNIYTEFPTPVIASSFEAPSQPTIALQTLRSSLRNGQVFFNIKSIPRHNSVHVVRNRELEGREKVLCKQTNKHAYVKKGTKVLRKCCGMLRMLLEHIFHNWNHS